MGNTERGLNPTETKMQNNRAFILHEIEKINQLREQQERDRRSRQLLQQAIRTINQIPPNTILANIYPEPTDPKKKKDYVHNITLVGISEIDSNVIVSCSKEKKLGRMSPVNFLITTGIASFEVDTHLLKIHQKILDQYLPKPEQNPINQPNSGL